jgi:NAD(P)-dependent dehydrogenase (short-subunit alcohol dehydrogenase family)
MTSPFPIRNLIGKKAVITGGTHGMGLAVGKALLAAGAEVLLTGRNPANVEAARLELADERARVLISDSADLGAIDQLAETVREQFGRFDFLHVNAGLSALQPIAEVTEADYDLAFNLNTKGAFFATQRLLPLLVDGGSIVFTSSIADESGTAGMGVYSASKAAMRSFAKVLAAELLPRAIRVNVVSPRLHRHPDNGRCRRQRYRTRRVPPHWRRCYPDAPPRDGGRSGERGAVPRLRRHLHHRRAVHRRWRAGTGPRAVRPDAGRADS